MRLAAAHSSSKDSLVQFAVYPGVEGISLPNGLLARTCINAACKSLARKRQKPLFASWRKALTSPLCCALLVDIFWWIWLDQFGPSGDVHHKVGTRCVSFSLGHLVAAPHTLPLPSPPRNS